MQAVTASLPEVWHPRQGLSDRTRLSRGDTFFGKLAEWLIAPDLKSVVSCEPGREGSNPSFSASVFLEDCQSGLLARQAIPMAAAMRHERSNRSSSATIIGEMPERLNGARWKRDGCSNEIPEFEPPSLRQFHGSVPEHGLMALPRKQMVVATRHKGSNPFASAITYTATAGYISGRLPVS